MLRRFLSSLRRDERGATAIEYGLIIALIFLVIISAVTAFGARTGTMYENIKTAVTSAMA